MRAPVVLSLPLLALAPGCWKTVDNTFPGGLTFEPEACAATPACAVEGWEIWPYDLPMTCPDGESGRAYLLRPSAPTGQQAVALYFHSGAFDYVRNPGAVDPLTGVHLHDPPRLEFEWSARKVFATLGMGPDAGGRPEDHTGALPAALAEAGIASFYVANCWGDYWHNDPGAQPNDKAADKFDRNGLAAAKWAWRVVTEPAFATQQGVDLGMTVKQAEIYLVGQGEGGRAVSELLTDGKDPAGVFLDSTADDLRTFYDGNQQLYGPTVTGLDRLFPDGRDSTTEGALGWVAKASLPENTVYYYSSLDSQVPNAAHDKAVAQIGAKGTVLDVKQSVHVVTAGDLEAARDAVDALTE